MEYYSTLKKKEILQYAMTWVSLEDIMLSEISQSQTNATLFYLNGVCKIVQFIASKRAVVVAQGQ